MISARVQADLRMLFLCQSNIIRWIWKMLFRVAGYALILTRNPVLVGDEFTCDRS